MYIFFFDNPFILQLTYKPFDAFLCKKFKMQQSCRLGYRFFYLFFLVLLLLFFWGLFFFIFFLITPSSSNSPTNLFDAFICKKFKMHQSCRLGYRFFFIFFFGFIIILFFLGTFLFFMITPSSSNSPTKPFEAFLCKKFKMQQSCRLGYRFFFLFFGFIILFFWDFYNFFFLLNSGSPKFFAL